MSTSWSIPGADNHPILGDTHLPNGDAKGVLIACHGFKGYKDYGFFPLLCQTAAARGLIAHRFNFSHSGMTNKLDTFGRADLFEQDTWGKQIHDLLTVQAATRTGELPGGAVDGLPITWFGHSRGGVTAVLAAARVDNPPDRLVAAAAPDYACNLDDAQRRIMHKQGYLESPSSRTGQVLRVGRAWLQEIEADPDAYDPLRAIGAIAGPVLILHGTNDATVPVSAACRLAEAAGEGVTLVEIEGASHTFDAPNPLPLDGQPPDATRAMIDHTCDFALVAAGGGG